MTIIINETGLNTAVSESGVTDTYSIVLSSQPTQNVTINIDGGTQLTTSPNQLIFTSQNWNIAQTVTVAAIDDTAVEGNHTGTIQHTVVSNDPQYSNLVINPLNVAITDNDRSGISVIGTINVNVIVPNAVLVTQTDGNTSVTEGGATDTYRVVLNGEPTSDVIVTINSGSQLTTDKTQLTFTPQNWNIAQTVTVTAVNDTVVEGNHTGIIQHTVTSNDSRFNNFPASSVNVAITDNDVANPYSVIITQSGGSTAVTEGRGTDSYTVVLSSRPTANVTININSSTQLVSSTNRLVFTPDNWNLPQTVTIAAVDDVFVEGNHSAVINFAITSNDTNFNNIPVTPLNVTITDNDLLGVIINQTDGNTNVTEGGATDTYTVVLSSQPSSNVVINLNSGTQLATDKTQLTFTPQNWNIAQTVTVTAIDDSLIEATPHSGTIQYTASSSDNRYNGITINPVNVSITDNDRVLVTLSDGNTNVTEGGATVTYTVVLNSQPTSNVVINLNSGTQLTTDKTQLTFTPQNWNIAQTVTVTAVDDAVVEGNHTGIIQHTVTSSDANFTNTSVNSVNVNITDNDVSNPSVIITQSNGSTVVTEGSGTDTYTVVLGDRPTANVTININNGTQLVSSTNRLVFTSDNWNLPQIVTIAAVNDTVVEGVHTGVIQFTVTSPDVNYNNLPVNPLTVTINDNDIGTPGVIITQTNGNTAVTEGGTTDSYTVVLSAPPTSNVVFNINSGTQLSTSSNQLTFTPQNWNIAQNVTVTAVDDTVVEGAHTGTISHTISSSDSNYNNLTVAPINVAITDNDNPIPANVIITQSGGNTAVTEGGATDSYTVVLSTQPTANVTINLNSGTQLSTSSNQLTFTPQNWNSAQTVTVTAVDDSLVEGTHNGTIQHTVTSTDNRYSTLTINPINVSITDNDPVLGTTSLSRNNDVFNIVHTEPKIRLQVNLVNTNAFNANGAAFSVDELGYFLVDDAQGRVNGLLPSDAGYTEAALSRAQVLLSGVPNFPGQISDDRQRLVELDSGSNFRFLLVRNSSLDNVRQGNISTSNVLFGTPNTQIITNLATNEFSIGWEDGTGAVDFQDLVVTIKPTTQATTVGANLQTRSQGEVLDLRAFTGQIAADFTVTRDGVYNDYVGFYRVSDENGGIDTNGDGVADVNPGSANYITEAVNRRVTGINLTVGATPGTATYPGAFQGGGIYAPFIIANGRPADLFDNIATNDPPVYFPYLAANKDQNRDHIRLLGDNYFGFEDLPLGNTDFDHNDFTVKVNLLV